MIHFLKNHLRPTNSKDNRPVCDVPLVTVGGDDGSVGSPGPIQFAEFRVLQNLNPLLAVHSFSQRVNKGADIAATDCLITLEGVPTKFVRLLDERNRDFPLFGEAQGARETRYAPSDHKHA